MTRKLLGCYQGKGEIGQGRGIYQSNSRWIRGGSVRANDKTRRVRKDGG